MNPLALCSISLDNIAYQGLVTSKAHKLRAPL